jgi:hypothetical protein
MSANSLRKALPRKIHKEVNKKKLIKKRDHNHHGEKEEEY